MNDNAKTLDAVLTTYESAMRALWVAMNVEMKTAEECTKLSRLVHFGRTGVEMKGVKIMGDTDQNYENVMFYVSDLTCWFTAFLSNGCSGAEYRAQRDHFIKTITGVI